MRHTLPRPRRGHARSVLSALAPLVALLLVAAPAAAHGPAHDDRPELKPPSKTAEIWSVENVVTSLSFDAVQLADLGLKLENVRTTGTVAHHDLSVASRERDLGFAAVPPLSLGLEVDRGVLVGFRNGGLQHQGGFDLTWQGGEAAFQGFVLRPAQVGTTTDPRAVEILATDGAVLLYADFMHYELAESELSKGSDRLDVFNADLRMGAELARRLGEPQMADVALGVLSMQAAVRPSLAGEAPSEPIAGNPPPCGDFDTGDVDVGLVAIGSVSQAGREGGFIGVTPSARLKNEGTANVPWYSKFSGNFPPYDNDQHPYLVWALYRFADGRVDQLGISDVKHAFLTINVNCDQGACTDSHILGLGCEDVYGTGTNNSYNSLSFRDEVESNLGLWESTGSHFDQNGNGSQDHPPNNPDSGLDHRMKIPEADLDTPGAEYWIEAWYVVREDIDIFNSMGRERVTPSQSQSSGNWSFPTMGGTFEQGPALDLWVDPDAPPAGTANSKVDTRDGWIQLAVRTTDLGDGLWRYEYALMNFDFDRKVASVDLPHGGAAFFDFTFRDVDQDASNDWQVTVGPDALTIAAPAGVPADQAALDWGTMLSFGFTSDAPPSAQDATVSAQAQDLINEWTLASQTPGAGSGSILFIDRFESGDTSAWGAAVP